MIEKSFVELWRAYPLKKGKQAALRALEKKMKGKSMEAAKALLETIWSGLKAYLDEHGAKSQLKAQGADIWVPELPHLSTWINQCRWEDEHQLPQSILQGATRKQGLDLSAIEARWNQ